MENSKSNQSKFILQHYIKKKESNLLNLKMDNLEKKNNEIAFLLENKIFEDKRVQIKNLNSLNIEKIPSILSKTAQHSNLLNNLINNNENISINDNSLKKFTNKKTDLNSIQKNEKNIDSKESYFKNNFNNNFNVVIMLLAKENIKARIVYKDSIKMNTIFPQLQLLLEETDKQQTKYINESLLYKLKKKYKILKYEILKN